MSGLSIPNHGPEGAWASLKGGTLAPHLQSSMESSNSGEARFNGEVSGAGSWESLLLPNVPMTRGGGTMAK